MAAEAAARPTPWLAWDHHRNLTALAIAAVVTPACAVPVIVALGAGFTVDTVVLVAFVFWTFYAVTTLVLTFRVFAGASPQELRQWVEATKPATWTRSERAGWLRPRPSLTVQWAILAMVSVAIVSLTPELTDSFLANALSVAVVAAAWAVTGVAYAVHYARVSVLYGGLDFPGEHAAVFSDFLYLSAQVGTTFSTSDVSITTARARRIVTGHTILSFCFGTVIIAVLLAVIFFSD